MPSLEAITEEVKPATMVALSEMPARGAIYAFFHQEAETAVKAAALDASVWGGFAIPEAHKPKSKARVMMGTQLTPESVAEMKTNLLLRHIGHAWDRKTTESKVCGCEYNLELLADITVHSLKQGAVYFGVRALESDPAMLEYDPTCVATAVPGKQSGTLTSDVKAMLEQCPKYRAETNEELAKQIQNMFLAVSGRNANNQAAAAAATKDAFAAMRSAITTLQDDCTRLRHDYAAVVRRVDAMAKRPREDTREDRAERAPSPPLDDF